MGECKKLDRLCRICTVEADGICIFSEEGKRNKLEAKIKKYLYIAVSVEDKLPKMVCSNCSKTLDGVHKFASMAIKMQEKLNEFLKIQSEELSTKSDIADDDDDDDDEDHSGSLLHSILTNGQSCGSRESSPNPEVTEVEVRVDPMLFLCELDETSTDNDQQTEVSNSSVQDEQQHHSLMESHSAWRKMENEKKKRILTEEQRKRKNERERLYRAKHKLQEKNNIENSKIIKKREFTEQQLEAKRERSRQYRLKCKLEIESNKNAPKRQLTEEHRQKKIERSRQYRLRKKLEKQQSQLQLSTSAETTTNYKISSSSTPADIEFSSLF